MTVQQLIDELQKYPKDMPIAIYDDINWINKDIPEPWYNYGIGIGGKENV